MYRPQNRFQMSVSNRHNRRAAKSVLRSNRHDQRWMSQYKERQERVKRWKNAFGFLPLNFMRFASLLAAFVSSLNDSLDSLLSAQRSPGALHMNRAGEMRWGGKRKKRRKTKSTRAKSKQVSAANYEALEPRQLLAADVFTLIDSVSGLTFQDGTNPTIRDSTPTFSGDLTDRIGALGVFVDVGNLDYAVHDSLGAFTGVFGASINGQGNDQSFLFTTASLPDGDFQLRVNETFDSSPLPDAPLDNPSDGLGGVALDPVDDVFNFTIDTTAPPIPTITSIVSDTGSSNSDGITRNNSIFFQGTQGETGTRIEVRNVVTGAIVATDLSTNNSTNFITDPLDPTFAEGVFAFDARAIDSVGNASNFGSNFSVRIDNTDPVTSFTNLNPVTYTSIGDSGTSVWPGSIDTNSFDVGGVDSLTYQITQNSTGSTWDGASFTSSPSTVTNAADGATNDAESLPFPLSNFPATGDYTVVANATDLAGNVENTATVTFTVLVAADVTTVDLRPSSDSGVLGDRITNVVSPVVDVSVVGAAVNDILELREADGQTGFGAVTSLAAGASTIGFTIPTTSFSEGSNTFRAYVNGVEDTSFNLPTLTLDTIAPTVAISDDEAGVASIPGGDVLFTFDFPEDVVGFDDSDIVLTGGAAGAFTALSPSQYTLVVTPDPDSTDDITVDVAAGVATDVAGNPNEAAAQAIQAVDTVAPTVVITDDETGVANIAGGDVVFTFTFSEGVTGFDAGDVVVAGGTPGTFTATSSTVYTLAVTPDADSTADITVDVAAGVAIDEAGNENIIATQAVQEVDTLAPTVSITDDEPGVANIAGGDVVFTFTFSEDVTGFTAGDVVVAGGTLGAFTATSATVYTLAVTPDADSTTDITVDVAAGVAIDANGNPNVAAAQAIQPVDTTTPTIAITSDQGTSGDTLFDSEGNATLTFTLSEDSTTFDIGDIDVTAGTLSGFVGSGSVYTVQYTPPAGVEDIETVSVAAGAFTDLAGNPSTAAATVDLLIDTNIEKVSIIANDNDPQEDLNINVNSAVTFLIDEASDGVTTINFEVIGGTEPGEATAGVDFVVPGATLSGQTYTGSIQIANDGSTSIPLDIDVLPDIILEGDETFTVRITSVTNTAEDVMVDAAANSSVVTIEDDETGAIVTLTATDEHAAENPLDIVPIDLSGISVLTDVGGTTRTTLEGELDVFFIDVFDNEYENITLFGTASSGDASVSVRFIYDDGPALAVASQTFVEGVTTSATYEADPTRVLVSVEVSVNTNNILSNNGDGGEFVFTAAQGTFKGDSEGSYRLELDTELTSDLTVNISTTGDSTAVNGVDYTLQVFDEFEIDFNAAATGFSLTAPYVEDGFTLSVVSEHYDIFSGVPNGNFANVDPVGATVRFDKGGDPFDLNSINFLEDGQAGIVTSSTGTTLAVTGGTIENFSGPDWEGIEFFEIEATSFFLAFDDVNVSAFSDLPGSDTVSVTIPAGSTFVDIQLVAIDDNIIEGGLVDSPGIETAELEIISDSGLQSNVVSIGNPDSGVVKIEDNDFGTVRLEAVDDTASENLPDSAQYDVFLERTNSTVTGTTESSEDTLISVDIMGEALPGADYQTSITNIGGNNSFADARRIDGFWSQRLDNDISNSTTRAHNTVRSAAGNPGIHFYEIVLYEDGQLRADIDRTGGGLDSHLRIFRLNPNGSTTVIAGNNNSTIGTGAGGSTDPNDSFIQINSLDAGTYFIEVSEHNIGGGNTNATANNRVTAMDGDDFYTLNVSLTNFDEGILIPAGQTMTSFNIDPIDDNIVEGGTDAANNPGVEDVEFTLDGFERNDPDISILGGGTETDSVTILDNDTANVNVTVPVSIADENPLPSPPNDDTIDGRFRFTLNNESSTDTEIQFTILGFNTTPEVEQTSGVPTEATFGTGQDYIVTLSDGTSVSVNSDGEGTITILAGDTSIDLIVDVNNEDIIEDNETVRIVSEIVTSDPNITIDGLEHVVTINDEDSSDVAINGTAFALEGGQNGEFTVSLDSPKVSDSDTLVQFRVLPSTTLPAANLPGTGTAAGTPPTLVFDYTVPEGGDVDSFDPSTGIGVVRINAFSPDAKIVVVANNDDLIEDTEFARIELLGVVMPGGGDSNITSPDPGFSEAEIEIQDNDTAFVKITRVRDGAEPGGVVGGVDNNGLFRVDLVNADGDPVFTSVPITVNYTVLDSSTASGADNNNGVNADYRASQWLSGRATGRLWRRHRGGSLR